MLRPRGVATGVYGYVYPKITPSKLFKGLKVTPERLLYSFIPPPPQKTYIPQKTKLSGYTPAPSIHLADFFINNRLNEQNRES